MKKRFSKLLRWETMLVVLLIVLWVVFEARDNSLDAALLAKGRKAKDVFNFAKMLNGMGVYMLYSFMALGMSLILGMGDIDISVGASATLSASVMGISYRALINGGRLCHRHCRLPADRVSLRFPERFSRHQVPRALPHDHYPRHTALFPWLLLSLPRR